MRRFSSNIRIVVGLISLTISSLLVASLVGLIPNANDSINQRRRSFCETTAINFTSTASHMSLDDMKLTLEAIVANQDDVETLGVRRADGTLMLQIGDHAATWKSIADTPAVDEEFIVAVMSSTQAWGRLEVRFQPMSGILGLPIRTDVLLSGFVGLSLLFAFSLYLNRVLQHLNPSRVIPPRVREALDALAEGLLVVDTSNRIVLANLAFANNVKEEFDKLIGTRVSQLGFTLTDQDLGATTRLPWEETQSAGTASRGVLMKRTAPDGVRSTYSVSSVPIHDERGRVRGAVISFEDVSELDRKQRELREALTSLTKYSDEIRQQNKELTWLATRDGLTGCINRRSFFKMFDDIWHHCSRNGKNASAMMVDIDHFKSINDTYGHSRGDEVLRQVAAAIMTTAGESDIVCRYGGEEFSVLMPETALDEAELMAERIRLAIMGLDIEGLRVTASLGVSSSAHKSTSPQDLLDQADKCLYVAKRNGRNRVIRYDRATDQIAQLASSLPPTRRQSDATESVTIPFQAVSALLSALAFRDRLTASHCRRVADLCVAVGEGLLSMRECYTLETAALLHDIGKIGVPDSILQKSGSLTTDEWQVMRRHVAMGVHLVRASFGSDALTDIVQQHSTWFDLSNVDSTKSAAAKPNVGARILAIADAFDSMTSEAAYRKRRSNADAFEELRQCAGTQFDPELVERFILRIGERSHRDANFEGMSTDFALDIGMQIERLVSALDDQDMDSLKELAMRMNNMAKRSGIDHMSEVTLELHQALEEGADAIEITTIATQLLDLCRLTQVSLIQEHTYQRYAPDDAALMGAV